MAIPPGSYLPSLEHRLSISEPDRAFATGDFGIAIVGFVLLVVWPAPPLVVVAFSAAAGTVMALV